MLWWWSFGNGLHCCFLTVLSYCDHLSFFLWSFNRWVVEWVGGIEGRTILMKKECVGRWWLRGWKVGIISLEEFGSTLLFWVWGGRYTIGCIRLAMVASKFCTRNCIVWLRRVILLVGSDSHDQTNAPNEYRIVCYRSLHSVLYHALTTTWKQWPQQW